VGSDKYIFIIVLTLMTIGAIFSFSLPIYIEMKYGYSQWHFFIRYIIFAGIGIFIMITLAQLNPNRIFNPLGWFLFLVSLITIIVMPKLPSTICPTIKGARRWISLWIVNISPLEFLKIGIIFFFSWSFSRKLIPKHFPTFKDEFFAIIPYLILLAFVAFFVVIFQSDLGETLLILSVFTIMLLFTKVSSKVFLFLISAGGLLLIIGLMQKEYRWERVKSSLYTLYLMMPDFIQNWFSISNKDIDISYQLKQSMQAIYNGGFTGVGIGNGEIKMGFLSDVHTDFVLAGIAEETGVWGVIMVVSLVVTLVWRIFRVANRIETKTQRDYNYQLFCVGIGVLIFLETLLNMLGIVGLLPLKGLPIPFVSYGGSSIIAFSIAIGMVLMISKKADLN